MEENRKFYLIIKGGDAAESYVATLRFSQVGLEYRKKLFQASFQMRH